MPRYDKYEPFAGGFRARMAADFAYTSGKPNYAHADLGVIFGVGLDTAGKVVKGAGQTGVVGVLVLTIPKAAGDVVDIMTSGEIVEAGLVAGTKYEAAAADGAISTLEAAAATDTRIGHTVEADRLIVRVLPGVGV